MSCTEEQRRRIFEDYKDDLSYMPIEQNVDGWSFVNPQAMLDLDEDDCLPRASQRNLRSPMNRNN